MTCVVHLGGRTYGSSKYTILIRFKYLIFTTIIMQTEHIFREKWGDDLTEYAIKKHSVPNWDRINKMLDLFVQKNIETNINCDMCIGIHRLPLRNCICIL